MIKSLIYRLKTRKYHALKYAKLGYRPFDIIKLAWLGWNKPNGPNCLKDDLTTKVSARIKPLEGKSLTLCPIDICHLSIFEELFVYHCYDLDLPGYSPEIILDIGAHIGLFSISASARWSSALIFAFEPHPQNAEWARINFVRNKIPGCVIEAVAGSSTEPVYFDATGGMGKVTSGDGSILLPSVDLKSFVHSFSGQRILIKMDIEGAELDLLPRLFEFIPAGTAIFVELHGSLGECEALMQLIRDYHYKISINSHRLSQDRVEHYMDLFLAPLN